MLRFFRVGCMKEDLYWVQHNGNILVAYYTNGETEYLETGRAIKGIWHPTRGDNMSTDTTIFKMTV